MKIAISHIPESGLLRQIIREAEGSALSARDVSFPTETLVKSIVKDAQQRGVADIRSKRARQVISEYGGPLRLTPEEVSTIVESRAALEINKRHRRAIAQLDIDTLVGESGWSWDFAFSELTDRYRGYRNQSKFRLSQDNPPAAGDTIRLHWQEDGQQHSMIARVLSCFQIAATDSVELRPLWTDADEDQYGPARGDFRMPLPALFLSQVERLPWIDETARRKKAI